MKNAVNVSEFRNNIATYIDKIIYHDASYLIKKGNKVVARIIPHQEAEHFRKKIRKQSLKDALMNLAGAWSEEDVEGFEKDRQKIKEISKKDTINTI